MLLTLEQGPSVKTKSSRATSLETQKLFSSIDIRKNTHLRSCVTISEAKTKVYWCPPASAGKLTFASFQFIPWSPSFFHNKLTPLPSLYHSTVIIIHFWQYLRSHELQHANLSPVHEEPKTKAEMCACVQRFRFQHWHFPSGIAIRTG